MKNFPINIDGKEYWIARNVAVSCFVFTKINKEWCVLANKRGNKTPDFQGFWNCPCGYLDFDETTEQAAKREVFEETGIELSYVKFWEFDDNPNSNLQNITFRYYSFVYNSNFNLNTNAKSRGGEDGEVSEIKWIPIKNINEYDWAFGHDKLINNLVYKLELYE